MIGKFFKKITGIQAIEDAKAVANKELLETEAKVAEVKLTPKERATAKGEPWVAVLDTHVNKDNIRNGFFELDWNPEFVVKLKQEGYGYDGDPDEEIVDRWFKDLARNVLADEGQDTTRGAGYINVRKLASGKSEIE
jgi:hypothetical protein